MARSPKKKAAPAKKSGKTAFGRRESETERKAVQKAPRSPFRGASETEGKAVAPRQKAPRRPAKAVPKKSAPKAPKVPKKVPKTPKVVRDKRGRVRDYAAEYQRRMERAAALQISKNVARGHPKRGEGEVGRAELRDLKAAARVDSPGDQRRNGVKRPKSSALRAWARERVAELAGLTGAPAQKSTDATRRGSEVEQFAAKFVELGLGTISQAYHLWFSP